MCGYVSAKCVIQATNHSLDNQDMTCWWHCWSAVITHHIISIPKLAYHWQFHVCSQMTTIDRRSPLTVNETWCISETQTEQKSPSNHSFESENEGCRTCIQLRGDVCFRSPAARQDHLTTSIKHQNRNLSSVKNMKNTLWNIHTNQ